MYLSETPFRDRRLRIHSRLSNLSAFGFGAAVLGGRFCVRRPVRMSELDDFEKDFVLGNPVIGTQPDGWRWLPKKITESAGRARARRKFQLRPCQGCGKPSTERHHVNGRTVDNTSYNVRVLCRRCHMLEDGRLERVRARIAEEFRVHVRNCLGCGRFFKHGGSERTHCTACVQ